MPPRSNIEAMYRTVSVQQMNLLPENTTKMMQFSQKSILHISDHLAVLKFQ